MPQPFAPWFPPFQEQAIVGDHRLVIRCFAWVLLLAVLVVPCHGFARALQSPWGYGSHLDLLCWEGLPCWGVAPVDVGAVAALVSATKATPHQERSGGHVQSVRVDLPIP